MKKVRALLLTLLSLSLLGGAASCEMPDSLSSLLGGNKPGTSTPSDSPSDTPSEDNSPSGDQNDDSTDDTPTEEPDFDAGIELSDASTVIPAAYALEKGATLDGTYTLKGQIISSDGYNAQYNDISVTIAVEGYEDFPIYCYQIKNDADKIGLGDYIVVQGTIKNYKGTVEFDKPTMLAYKDGTLAPSIDVTPSAGTGIAEGYDVITVEQALAIAMTLEQESVERYYIHATIDSVTNAKFGEMTISDATGSIYVYGTYSADGSIGYQEMTEKPLKGAEVLLACTLNTFEGIPQVKNARLIDFKAATLDESAYTEMNIEDARSAEKGTLIKASGVVAQITYANGLVPNGFYLVDDTNSIYVYDGDLAANVTAGNTVTVLAEKDWWILDDEQESAAKFGYQGCNQLTNAWLLANDNGNTEPDYSWVEESTVKAVMETPFTTDITTTVYKVTALVKKSVGAGFINYYIDDLDGKTGSYVYTQASGSDLDWLEPFDNKICTVYLSVLNAKSTATGCNWRFKALKVVDENFTFDVNNAPQFAIDYHAADQFADKYTADPALEVITSVSSELLGFENVVISYQSDKPNVIYFEDGVMHTGSEYGTANIVITASLDNVTATKTIQVTYEKALEIDYITVAEAIVAADDTTVVVKGIVGPSVVNKAGFYLFGEDGSTITVLFLTESDFANIEIGQEVILSGKRERYVKDSAVDSTFGQSSIVDATILVNNMGNHAYNTSKFVEGKTTSDLYNLNKMTDYSTTVFVITGKLDIPTGNSQPSITDASGTKFSFYCSGSSQFAFLHPYAGQEVTLEIAACNWNSKTYWRGCAIAIRLADGSKIFNTWNFDKY